MYVSIANSPQAMETLSIDVHLGSQIMLTKFVALRVFKPLVAPPLQHQDPIRIYEPLFKPLVAPPVQRPRSNQNIWAMDYANSARYNQTIMILAARNNKDIMRKKDQDLQNKKEYD